MEALCGAHFFISTLDGRQLQVSSEGQVIKPDSWMKIQVGAGRVAARGVLRGGRVGCCFGSVQTAQRRAVDVSHCQLVMAVDGLGQLLLPHVLELAEAGCVVAGQVECQQPWEVERRMS